MKKTNIGIGKSSIYCLLSLMILFTFSACGHLPGMLEISKADMSAPGFLGLRVLDNQCLRIDFNESVIIPKDEVFIYPDLGAISLRAEACCIFVSWEDESAAGEKYVLKASAYDSGQNALHFMYSFYGNNSRLPQMRINEITTKGSKNHPDIVEFLVLEAGNLAGMTFYEGTVNDWSERFIFPDLDVSKGDYVLLHLKPEGIAKEINEVLHKSQSAGKDSSVNAWDFWNKEAGGLSGNNGVISLYESPVAAMMDALIYSNRKQDSDDKYQGWGSSSLWEQAEYLKAEGQWEFPRVIPEYAVRTENTTSTRSLCRKSPFLADKNSAADWHTVPTSSSSFGGPNSNEVYIDD